MSCVGKPPEVRGPRKKDYKDWPSGGKVRSDGCRFMHEQTVLGQLRRSRCGMWGIAGQSFHGGGAIRRPKARTTAVVQGHVVALGFCTYPYSSIRQHCDDPLSKEFHSCLRGHAFDLHEEFEPPFHRAMDDLQEPEIVTPNLCTYLYLGRSLEQLFRVLNLVRLQEMEHFPILRPVGSQHKTPLCKVRDSERDCRDPAP